MRDRFRIVVALSLFVPACQWLAGGFDDERGAPRTTVGGDAASGPMDPCVLRGPPGPPTGTNLAGDGTLTYFAMKKARFAPQDQQLGYDLDGLCTGLDGSARGGASCLPRSSDVTPDGDGGIDNAFRFVLQFAGISGKGEDPSAETLNDALSRGDEGILFGLLDYNGADDDDSVSLGLVPSPGFDQASCVTSPDGGGPATPTFTACDRWTVQDGGNVVDGRPAEKLPGYVRGRVLVVRGNSVLNQVVVAAGGVRLRIFDPLITARIDANGGALLDGIVAGRALAADAIRGIGGVPSNGHALCHDSLFPSVTRGICGARDLTASAAKGADAPCEAVSVGIGFDAYAAGLGGTGDPRDGGDCSDVDASCE